MPDILTHLKDALSTIEIHKSVNIAFSGGMDSSVLLHATHKAAQITGHTVEAIHIDHQLHADSAQWREHCEQQCQTLGITVSTVCVDIKEFRHLGVEGAAREARYRAFEASLSHQDVLFTAHHADDQVETVLLQLMRGSGAQGLAGCAPARQLGQSWLMRPLINITRLTIEQYAKQHKLCWLNDPSNESDAHDRNYLRHHVMPALKSRWPQLQEAISRSRQWQSECTSLLESLAESDAHNAIDDEQRLTISKIISLEDSRIKNVLRWWIKTAKRQAPSAKVMQQIMSHALTSREDSQLCIRWQENEIRKYQGQLYLQTLMPDHDAKVSYQWNIQQALNLPDLKLQLSQDQLIAMGVNINNIQQLTVKFRQGGEVMRPRARGCQKTLKALFQEQGIPPWLRDRIPLLFHEQELIVVWNHWVAEGY